MAVTGTGLDHSPVSRSKVAVQMSMFPPRLEANTISLPPRLTFGIWSTAAVLSSATACGAANVPSPVRRLRKMS